MNKKTRDNMKKKALLGIERHELPEFASLGVLQLINENELFEAMFSDNDGVYIKTSPKTGSGEPVYVQVQLKNIIGEQNNERSYLKPIKQDLTNISKELIADSKHMSKIMKSLIPNLDNEIMDLMPKTKGKTDE